MSLCFCTIFSKRFQMGFHERHYRSHKPFPHFVKLPSSPQGLWGRGWLTLLIGKKLLFGQKGKNTPFRKADTICQMSNKTKLDKVKKKKWKRKYEDSNKLKSVFHINIKVSFTIYLMLVNLLYVCPFLFKTLLNRSWKFGTWFSEIIGRENMFQQGHFFLHVNNIIKKTVSSVL